MKIKIVFFIIVSILLSCFHAIATDLMPSKDSLLHRLQSARTPQDSIPILYHLCDLSKQIDKVSYYNLLYTAAEHANEAKIQLDILRAMCNTFLHSDSVMAICQQEAEILPINDEQRETVVFIKLNRIAANARRSSEKEKAQKVQKLISEYKQEKSRDLYEDILRIYCVCTYLSNTTTGELYLQYMEKLELLIKQLPSESAQVLPNLFYTQAANIYTDNEEHEKAIAADKELLKIIRNLTQKYALQGRIFRNYDINYYNCYRRMLSNYPALSRKEIEEYYQRIMELCQKNSSVLHDYKQTGRPLIYYLMGTQQYDKALPLLKEYMSLRDNRPQKKQFLRFMIEASKATQDDATLLTATTEYNKLLEEYDQAKAAEKYRELQILYDVNELESKNAQLELDKRNAALEANQRVLNITLTAIAFLFILLIIVLLSYRCSNRLAQNLQRSKLKLQEEQKVLLQTQQDLTIARDQAESANKMKTIFLQNMSHEIRTPLNAIVGFSEVLVDTLPEELKEETKSYAEIISGNSELLLTLVGDVLDIAKLESNEMQPHLHPCSLDAVCNLVINSVKHRVRPNVAIYFKPETADDFTLLTDSSRLEQMLINLLSNASKFTQEGEIVLSYSVAAANRVVTFSVTDTGVGIPPDKAEIIFERFEQLDSFVQGTGLGLHICRLIAQMLQGEIMLDTTYTNGARFLFKHPIG